MIMSVADSKLGLVSPNMPVSIHNPEPADRKETTTLADVAARARVSVGTVSRILNGKYKEKWPSMVSRSAKIRRIAIKLGYRPNTAARSMSHGRFQAIGFVTCGDYEIDWYPINGLSGIYSVVEDMGWRLLINELPSAKIKDSALLPQLFRESAVDGLIVNLLPMFSRTIAYFKKLRLPYVLFNVKQKQQCVYPDDFSGAALAVSWLLSRDVWRIGYFCRSCAADIHYSMSDRLAGFQNAMKAANLESHRYLELSPSDDDRHMDVLQRAEFFLRRFPDVQGVICYESEEAVCLTATAKSLGIRVPNQLKVMGFNERVIRGNTGLPIETIEIPFYEVGQQCVKMLHSMIESQDSELPSVAIPYRPFRF